MKRMTIQEKIDALTNFLKGVSDNPKLYIYSVNLGREARFCIAETNEKGSAILTKSSFKTYDEMNQYLFGVLDFKQNRIDF